jgi:hypothetical protein
VAVDCCCAVSALTPQQSTAYVNGYGLGNLQTAPKDELQLEELGCTVLEVGGVILVILLQATHHYGLSGASASAIRHQTMD